MKKINFDKTKAGKKAATFFWMALRYALLIGISYTILYPLLTKLSLVFMKPDDLADFSVRWIPKHFTLSNIKNSIEILDYWKCALTTLLLCLTICTVQIIITTVSAYGLARFKSKGRILIFGLVIATLLIPPQTYIVTLYTQFQYFDIFGLIKLFTGSSVNILDTAWTFLVLAATGVGIRSGLYIYVQKQTFSALPVELEEAAKVDGAGMFKIFYSVMLPNTVPTVVMCFILAFVWQWNDIFYTNYFAPELDTLSMKVSQMNVIISGYLGDWAARSSMQAQLLASVSIFLCAVPLILFFIVCQKFFVQGFERSGLVG